MWRPTRLRSRVCDYHTRSALYPRRVPLDPSRTVAELRELQSLTGNADGAQRVAWTDTWERARSSFEPGWSRPAPPNWWTRQAIVVHLDRRFRSRAGDRWAPGFGPERRLARRLLNVLAGLEVMRRLAEDGPPPLTVRLVSWADEEGARFGRSLFGSSAAAGSMRDQDELVFCPTATASLCPTRSTRTASISTARSRLAPNSRASSPISSCTSSGAVLESLDLPLGVVLGTFGVERSRITWRGQAAHAGSTPMDKRRDALAGAAKLALYIREIAAEVGGGAVCTSGGVVTRPGIVTSVVETAEQLLDQRHLDAGSLARMLQLAKDAADRFAAEENIEVEWERIWNIEPILFDSTLIELADEAVREVSGTSHRLPSGPLHDAAEVARSGIPTVMLFVQSLRGLSHTKLEDTAEEHLELSVQALDRLASKTLERFSA